MKQKMKQDSNTKVGGMFYSLNCIFELINTVSTKFKLKLYVSNYSVHAQEKTLYDFYCDHLST